MSDKDYDLVVDDKRLKTYRVSVDGGWLYVSVAYGNYEMSVASTFVPATVVGGPPAEGLSDMTRARLRLEQAQSTGSSDRVRALVDEALGLLGGPLL